MKPKEGGIRPRTKGFTMIELMVVVLIIGLLVAIVIVNINDARKKGRDSRRKQDINTIQTAIEMYANERKAYPSTNASVENIISSSTTGSALISGGYLNTIPSDPAKNPNWTERVGRGRYVYWSPYQPGTGTWDYALLACTENDTSDGDKDASGGTWCTNAFNPNRYYLILGGRR